ncbi:NUDIX hydrolase [Indiicoccus explosivorum]|uniref:NUDIX hydrolase n=1 Tax=Indiicoccus explosivorum TaxID=1917864 RepID=UPI000B452B81|nr:NUDIX hydrolase [Indiicoccus explosivorum]
MMDWTGAAGICTNDKGELLMVLQGAPGEPRKWTVPSGGLEDGETYGECCIREFREETGYETEVAGVLHVKKGTYEEIGVTFTVHYFLVVITGGERCIQDPDGLIHDVAWKSADEIEGLDLSFPEDLAFIKEHLMKI